MQILELSSFPLDQVHDLTAMEQRLGDWFASITYPVRLLAYSQACDLRPAIGRLVRAGSGMVRVPRQRGGRLAALGTLMLSIGAGLAGGKRIPPLVERLLPTIAGRWPVVPLPLPVIHALPQALGILLPLLGALLVLALGQRLRGVTAQVRLARLTARMPWAVPLPPLLWPGRCWRAAAILSAEELSGIYHLPTPALGPLVRWLPCQHLPAPPHAFAGGEPDRLIIGTATHPDSSEDPVGLTFRDGREGLALTGPPGTGKTRLLARIGVQLAALGFFLVDGKGDDAGNLADVIRRQIPLADEARTVLLDVLDGDWPLGFNPLAGLDRDNRVGIDLVLGQIDAVFARLDPETWAKAPRMKDILRKGTLLVLLGGEPQTTLAHIKHALLDRTYRAQLLEHCTDREITAFWAVQAEGGGEQQKTSLEALISRFDRLLDSELTRYLFNQVAPAFSFQRAIAAQWIVLAPIPHRALGGLAGPVGMLLLQAFLQAAFRRPGSDQSRAEYGLVCDEFQVLIEHSDTKDVRDALTQVRSFGILTVIANQLLKQLGDLTDYALTAIANRVVLATQEPDASVYARHYQASGLTAADISNQEPNDHQYARIKCRGVPAGPFSMRPLPWLPPRDVRVSEESGPAWQTRIPPDSPTPQFDRALVDLVYGDHADLEAVAERLAAADAAQWTPLLARWDAIRQHQRAYILAHPGCIPLPPRPDGWDQRDAAAQAATEAARFLAQRLERQVWLSRLLAARPRILAMAEYARIRPASAAVQTTGRSRRAGAGFPSAGAASSSAGSPGIPRQHAHFADLDRPQLPAAAPAWIEPSDFELDDPAEETP